MNVSIDDQAGIAAGLGLAAVTVWKIWLRLKNDKRQDAAGDRENQAGESTHQQYGKIIEQLRTEVDRLGKAVNDMSERLRQEQLGRFEAEGQVQLLRAKVSRLESEVRILKGEPV